MIVDVLSLTELRRDVLGARVGAAGSSTCLPREAILVESLLLGASREDDLTREEGTDLDCNVTGLTLRH